MPGVVRKRRAINALNFYIRIAMTSLAHMTRRKAANTLLKSVLNAARPIKDTVQFYYYRIAGGISELLRHTSNIQQRFLLLLKWRSRDGRHRRGLLQDLRLL